MSFFGRKKKDRVSEENNASFTADPDYLDKAYGSMGDGVLDEDENGLTDIEPDGNETGYFGDSEYAGFPDDPEYGDNAYDDAYDDDAYGDDAYGDSVYNEETSSQNLGGDGGYASAEDEGALDPAQDEGGYETRGLYGSGDTEDMDSENINRRLERIRESEADSLLDGYQTEFGAAARKTSVRTAAYRKTFGATARAAYTTNTTRAEQKPTTTQTRTAQTRTYTRRTLPKALRSTGWRPRITI